MSYCLPIYHQHSDLLQDAVLSYVTQLEFAHTSSARCHDQLKSFGCAILVPQCSATGNKPIPPCRETCIGKTDQEELFYITSEVILFVKTNSIKKLVMNLNNHMRFYLKIKFNFHWSFDILIIFYTHSIQRNSHLNPTTIFAEINHRILIGCNTENIVFLPAKQNHLTKFCSGDFFLPLFTVDVIL